MIKKFAIAINDKNPFWQEVVFAKETKYGGIIAHPTFLMNAATYQNKKNGY